MSGVRGREGGREGALIAKKSCCNPAMVTIAEFWTEAVAGKLSSVREMRTSPVSASARNKKLLMNLQG